MIINKIKWYNKDDTAWAGFYNTINESYEIHIYKIDGEKCYVYQIVGPGYSDYPSGYGKTIKSCKTQSVKALKDMFNLKPQD